MRGYVREGDTVARSRDATLVAQKILESFVQPFRVEVREAGDDPAKLQFGQPWSATWSVVGDDFPHHGRY